LQKFQSFSKNLPPRDESPRAVFTKFGAEEGVPGPYGVPARQTSRLWL